jgi:hypothetical protein
MARRFLALVCLCLLVFTVSRPAYAADVQFQPAPVEYTFGGQVLFQVQIQSDTPLQSVTVFYRYEGQEDTHQGDAAFTPDGAASYTLEARQAQIPAFSGITYWFVATLTDGQTATSENFAFTYDDNRFEWQTLEALPLRLHAYGSNTASLQSLFDIARQGLEKINILIGALPTQEIDVFVYDNGLDMQSTLRLANVKWIAGHADPWLGVVVVTLPPGPMQMELSRQRIPHELMHILLYQSLGSGYQNIPSWLNEGLASMAELQNNPDYYTILQKAHEQELYLPFAGLCNGFPQEASNAFLAYAEAEFFTRYLYEQVGTVKMQELLSAYTDGLACERAPEVVLGKPLAQLETEWQRSLFGGSVWASGVGEVLPWLALLAVALFAPLVLMAYGPARSGRKS